MNTRPLLLLAALALSSASCGGRRVLLDPRVFAAPVLTAEALTSRPVFSCHQMNFAWGKVYRGAVIDAAGRIWSFDRRGQPWAPITARGLPLTSMYPQWWDGAALRASFASARSALQLPPESLASALPLVPAAARGAVSRTHVAADAGLDGCEAYLWHAELDAYQRVELGSHGDFEVTNAAPEAKQLLEWLRAVLAGTSDARGAPQRD